MDDIASFWLLLASESPFTVLRTFFVTLHLLFITLHVRFVGIYHVPRNIAIIIVRYHTEVDKLSRLKLY
jgi:hypothetical protein